MRRLLLLFALSMPASAQRAAPVRDDGPILAEVLDQIRAELPAGRLVLDRVIIDTTKHLAPPMFTLASHEEAERWARPLGVEVASTESIVSAPTGLWPGCGTGDAVGTVAFASPASRGDTAVVIARYREATEVVGCRVRTVVEAFYLLPGRNGWRIARRETRAVG